MEQQQIKFYNIPSSFTLYDDDNKTFNYNLGETIYPISDDMSLSEYKSKELPILLATLLLNTEYSIILDTDDFNLKLMFYRIHKIFREQKSCNIKNTFITPTRNTSYITNGEIEFSETFKENTIVILDKMYSPMKQKKIETIVSNVIILNEGVSSKKQTKLPNNLQKITKTLKEKWIVQEASGNVSKIIYSLKRKLYTDNYKNELLSFEYDKDIDLLLVGLVI